MGRSGGGPGETTITGPFEVDALAYGTAATGGTALAGAIAAADLAKHTTIAFPTGSSLTWDTTPAVPAGITGSLTVKFNDCLVTLTTSGIRLLDFHRTGNDQTFQNINIEGPVTVDAANLDGLALGAATTVTGSNVTIGAGSSANVTFGDVSTYQPGGFTTGGAIYVASGANAGQTFAYSKVNGTTLSVSNSTAGSVTFTVGDGITGSNKNHVVLGTLIHSGTTNQSRMSFDRVTVRNIRTINVPSSMTVAQTYRPNIEIGTQPATTTDPFQSTTNILVEDVDFRGGNAGVIIIAASSQCNVWHDRITVRRWRHSTGLVPTANVSGAHVQIGGGGYGGTCWVENGWGEYSADVGIETDSMTVANITDVVCEDDYGGAFFWTNFNSPGQSTGTAGPTTTTLSGNGGSIDNVSNFNVAAALPDPSGVVRIDSETITYTNLASSGTRVQGVQRGAYGTTAAAHNDGATVTVIDLRPQVVQYTRCHARRTRISPTGDFLSLGFYSGNTVGRPGAALRMRDCTYFRRGADYLTQHGEALYVPGGVPSVEVDGFNVVIEGVNHASGTTPGRAIVFSQPSTFAATTFPTPLSLRRVKVHASGSVQTADTFDAIYLDRGVWHLDWDDVYVSMQWPGIGNGHSVAVNLFANPTSYLSGKVKGLRVKSVDLGTPGGDLAPVGVKIPSTGFVVVRGPLVFEGSNFRDLQNSGTYTPFNVDATNAAAVVVRGTIHATVPAPVGFTGLVTGTGKAVGQLWNANAVLTAGTGTLITAVDYSTDGGTTYTNVLTQSAGALPAGANIVIPNLSSDALIKATFGVGTQPTITLVPINP